LLIPYLPFAEVFEFEPLPAPVLGAVLAITVAYVLVTEIVKRSFYRRLGSDLPGGRQ
jgi:Mg2+-importing ATPase